MPRLTKLEAVEVSLVPKGANRKKFLLTKSDEVTMNEAILKSLLESEIKNEDAINAFLKKNLVPESAYDSIKAAIRLLESVKNDLPSGQGGDILSTLSQWVGIEPPKPGVIVPTGKQAPGDMAGDGCGDGELEINMKKSGANNKGDKMPNEEILKALPEAARASVEAIFKANDEKLAEAVKKADESDKALKAELDAKVTKEFIEKAATLKSVPVKAERLGEILKTFSAVNKEMTEEIFGVLKAADEAIAKGALFSEKGSSASATGEKALDKIEKAAIAYATEHKMTPAAAMSHLLKTDETVRKLYNESESEGK